MATKTQERRERDASRAYNISRAAVAVSLLALCWQIYQSQSQKHSDEKQFGNIQTSLRLLTATVAPQLQQAIDDSLKAALDHVPIQPSQGSQALAKVETDTANLRKLKANLPAQQISQTAAMLEKAVNQYPDATSAWGAAAQMVSYRSDLRVEAVEQPDCYTTQGMGDWHFSDPIMKYHDCTLNLDDVAKFNAVAPHIWQGSQKAPTATGQLIPTILLKNGTVTYSGGKMIAIERLFCENCSFNLRSPENIPPPPGRALSQQLLTADLDSVSLNLPKT